QCPERVAPVARHARMLADDALERRALEEMSDHGAGREQPLANVVTEAVLEPVAERNGEALLFAPQEARRQVALHRLAQQVLLPAAGQLGAELHPIPQLAASLIQYPLPQL